ncbi:DUF1538 domain-containing protein [Dolosigranulum pigrum]|uniref:DUF1538 domain-containing protein n=1 Tax=Dolosigranulum pigrum TaxID=29394 RepID=UPI001AD89CA9|nr:DUF1538 domain-containing protein [Dolosigranulum pigrum]QTJ43256.1 DUF1538 domain-containing protein [Dolosigranulum pigrum]QTJ46671.1 DUF1538 domain-containing protein [Dolosigranulum pigrum]QTJ60192.1 DUF1538 domain-containing protein [Dolosigranulum pigrum]
MNILTQKFREVLQAVIPTYILVLLIHFFIVDLPKEALLAFSVGTLFIMAGMTIFLTGVDLAITPIGEQMGKGIARSNKVSIVVIFGFVLGFLIAASEPSINVLGQEIATISGGAVNAMAIVGVVSVGLAIMIVIGLLRIVYDWSLIKILISAYSLVFMMAIFTSEEFISISFDASGATTGAITVPFVLAMASGVANLKKGTSQSNNDSFGLVAIASVGAIIAVMLFNLLMPIGELTGSLSIEVDGDTSLLTRYISVFIKQLQDVLMTIMPIVGLFYVYQKFKLKVPKRVLQKIWIGSIYVFAGLVIFLTGVNAGFMDIGRIIGHRIASEAMYVELAIVGAVMGVVTILAEPATNILTTQIEDVTSGAIKRRPILIALTSGVGIAIFLAVLRMLIPGLKLWHILLPGYAIAIGLMFIVPKIFVGMAFDAGGVATGPITATFILAFIQGAADTIPTASVMIEGFGMIAMVALMPILTLQLLGFVYELKRQCTTSST